MKKYLFSCPFYDKQFTRDAYCQKHIETRKLDKEDGGVEHSDAKIYKRKEGLHEYHVAFGTRGRTSSPDLE